MRLYQVSNGRFLSTLGELGPPLWAVAFSPRRNWLAWGGEGQQIFFYDLVKDTLVDKFSEPYVPVRLAFSPDGIFLASHDHERGQHSRAGWGVGAHGQAALGCKIWLSGWTAASLRWLGTMWRG